MQIKKETYFLLLASIMTIILGGCGGGGDKPSGNSGNEQIDPSGDSPTLTKESLLVYPDASDPRVIGGWLEEGEKFEIYESNPGQSDTTMAGIRFISDGDQAESVITYNPQDQSLTAIEDGGSLTLKREADNSMLLTLSTNTGQINLNLLSDNDSLANFSAYAEYHNALRSRSLLPKSVEIRTDTSIKRIALESSPTIVSAQSTDQSLAVTINGCQAPLNRVQVIMRDETGTILDNIIATKGNAIGNVYKAVIPRRNSGQQALESAVGDAMDFLETMGIHTEGSKSENFLWSLNNIFNPFSSLDSAADKITEDTIKSLKETDRLNETYDRLGEELKLPSTDNIQIKERELRNSIRKRLGRFMKTKSAIGQITRAAEAGLTINSFVDAYLQLEFNQLQLSPLVVMANGTRHTGTSSGLISPDGVYPDLSVTIPGDTNVASLTLTPPNPSGQEDYIASTTISCLQKGDYVTMTVTGTDEYYDQIEMTAAASGEDEMALWIPTGDIGVKDTITVAVNRGGQSVTTHQTSLVFR